MSYEVWLTRLKCLATVHDRSYLDLLVSISCLANVNLLKKNSTYLKLKLGF